MRQLQSCTLLGTTTALGLPAQFEYANGKISVSFELGIDDAMKVLGWMEEQDIIAKPQIDAEKTEPETDIKPTKKSKK
jgi:hypothetical protein